jgi:hypothetical protein
MADLRLHLIPRRPNRGHWAEWRTFAKSGSNTGYPGVNILPSNSLFAGQHFGVWGDKWFDGIDVTIFPLRRFGDQKKNSPGEFCTFTFLFPTFFRKHPLIYIFLNILLK